MSGVAAAVAAGIGVAATVAGTAYSIQNSEEQNDKADAAAAGADVKQKEALQEFDKLKDQIPSVESQLYQLERFKSVGNLTPELEKLITQKETELKKIAVDPAYKAAQLDALHKYEDLASSDKLTPVQKAQLEKIKSDIGNFEKSNRDAILQAAEQRGTLSGGQVLTAQLMNNQNASNQASQLGFDVAAKGFDQQQEAIGKEAELAGQVRGQEYGEQKDEANAQDLIERFNTQQKTDVQRANVDRKNTAQASNLSNNQAIANANTGLSNEEARQKSAAMQQEFDNKLRIAAGKSGQLAGMASQQAGFANQAQQNAAAGQQAAAGGIAKIGAGLVNYGLKNWGSSTPTTTTTMDAGTPTAGSSNDPFGSIG